MNYIMADKERFKKVNEIDGKSLKVNGSFNRQYSSKKKHLHDNLVITQSFLKI